VAGGGSFKSGFMAASFSDAAGGDGSGSGPSLQGAVIHSVVGGFASVLGGGKFANGAVTGAFGYLFNQFGRHDSGEPSGPVKWNTGDFVAHYFDGKGETVDLANVGLASDFENSPSVVSGSDLFENYVLGRASPGYTTAREFSTYMVLDHGIDPLKNPLYSLGNGLVYASAACGKSACLITFSYRDWFQHPLAPTYNGELPGGTRYQIIDTWGKLLRYGRTP
jgi:hypothetical protein